MSNSYKEYASKEYVSEQVRDYVSKSELASQMSAAGYTKRAIVTTLPAVSDADANTIYMIKDASITSGDSYKEYMLVNGAFEQIGDTSPSFDGLATTEYVDSSINNIPAITTAEIDEICGAAIYAASEVTL